MKSKWMVYAKKADFDGIGSRYNIDPVVARIIRNRDIKTCEEIEMYLNGSRADFNDGFLMKDMSRAVGLVRDKIAQKKHIRIIGDYDIDGVSSIYILLKGLAAAGGVVDYVVPHRIIDGYGINEKLIKDAYDAGIDTIITCDNGIAAIEQIQYAKDLGLTVIVTDHHDIRYEQEGDVRRYILPCADAVVNPKQEDCKYPFKGLCGAVVAYKFIECLLKTLILEKSQTLGLKEADYRSFMDKLLEAAAIATVGDVMVLLGENRIIVKEGLKLLNNTDNLGLKSLMEINEISKGTLSSYHIGFVIGPCLNASGRLDSARCAVELLLAENKAEADRLAGNLKAFNDERKNLTNDQVEQAVYLVENTELKDDNVLVVYLPDCHESIAGIIAGRLRERYYKPTLVITNAEDGLKGSGRSIEGYNMFEHLLEVSSLMTKFGGHPMAAGVSLRPENLDIFRKKLNENANLTDEELTPVDMIDVPMPLDYITEDLLEQLSVLEPFGNGNEKPVFADKMLEVVSTNVFGKNKNVLKMILKTQSGRKHEAIQFNVDENILEEIHAGDILSIIYYPSINEYNGRRTIQIVVKQMKKTVSVS